MPCGLTPNQVLPRRYILRARVTSPSLAVTPNTSAAPVTDSPAAAPFFRATTKQAAMEKAHAEALREQKLRHEKILARVLFTIRDFPDAAAAVEQAFSAVKAAHPDPPDNPHG